MPSALAAGFRAVTVLGSTAWLVPLVAVAAVTLATRRRRRDAVGLIVLTATGAAATSAVKLLVAGIGRSSATRW